MSNRCLLSTTGSLPTCGDNSVTSVYDSELLLTLVDVEIADSKFRIGVLSCCICTASPA